MTTKPQSNLKDKIYISPRKLTKAIFLVKQARQLEEHQEKLKKQFIKLTSDDLEDYFWDLIYSIYDVEEDMKGLFTSKRLGWSQ